PPAAQNKLRKSFFANLCGRRKSLPEHPECCKERSLPVRICRYLSTQLETTLCRWTCCPCCYVFRRYVGYFILDPFIEL
uniref:Sodium channel protein n=1 Tax=Mesocestoides corti TaxID=53468 RepID=A0A5K3ESE2_MESCO